MSLVAEQLSYLHPDKEILFQNINLSIAQGQKAALIGNNGSGKSTLLRILAGEEKPSTGQIVAQGKIFYVPQHFGQYDLLTVAQALYIDHKINALHAILGGTGTDGDFSILDDDWNIEERALSALRSWKLEHIALDQPLKMLSGGEKTKVFLVGILIHSPEIVLMDEPSNHLDKESRKQLYDYIAHSKATLLIVSHDRKLLNLLPATFELHRDGITSYGGNYEFYKMQKAEAVAALQSQIGEKEKELRSARKIERETLERQQKHASRGEKQSIKKGIARIAMKTLQSNSEKSMSKLKDVHSGKMQGISDDLAKFRQQMPDINELKLNIEDASLHRGKILVTAEKINFGYTNEPLFSQPLDFQIMSGDRIVISGNNGSGKTTLLKLILGKLEPVAGTVTRCDFSYLYVDQEYSIINNRLNVYEQISVFNSRNLPEHELKMLLNRFLFPAKTWDKKCSNLSGGEKMRLLFCCLQVSNNTPDVFILDEPTNNLDIASLEIVTAAVKAYRGTVLLISHDEYFINEIEIDREIMVL